MILKLVLLVVLIIGLIFIFIYLAISLKNLSEILGDVKKVTDRVENVTKSPERIKNTVEEIAVSAVDKVVEKQVNRVKLFVSRNVLGNVIKVLDRS